MKGIFDRISKGPVGTGEVEVENGQCVSSIAYRAGTFWEDVWEANENEELREVRQHPNLLLPRDRVWLPEQEAGEVEADADQRHAFVVHGIPCALRLRFTKLGWPRADEVYEVWQGDTIVDRGTLDHEGTATVPIDPTWDRITVFLGKEEAAYDFELGTIAPVTEPRGLQTRLWNLDYYRGPLCDEFTEETEDAFRRFMLKNGMKEEVKEGVDEAAMKDALALLVNLHGC